MGSKNLKACERLEAPKSENSDVRIVQSPKNRSDWGGVHPSGFLKINFGGQNWGKVEMLLLVFLTPHLFGHGPV